MLVFYCDAAVVLPHDRSPAGCLRRQAASRFLKIPAMQDVSQRRLRRILIKIDLQVGAVWNNRRFATRTGYAKREFTTAKGDGHTGENGGLI